MSFSTQTSKILTECVVIDIQEPLLQKKSARWGLKGER